MTAESHSILRTLAVSLGLGAVLLAGTALAWTRQAEFEARVHKHVFTKIALETSDCQVRYRLEFVAPTEAYPKTGEGVYRFHARIKLSEGRALLTPTFVNRSPGKRTYGGVLDTSAEGCWAKEEHKLFGVDVEGCRGKTCKPEAFPPL
jgi:hypothetical protein